MILMSPEEFIETFKSGFNKKAIEDCFLNGNCWFFTTILRERFNYLNPEVYYEPVVGHFATKIGSRMYDITGEINDRGFISWEEYKKIEPTDSGRLLEYCILKTKK